MTMVELVSQARQKPLQEFFELALRRNNLLANEVLFVDDSDANIRAASALGLHTEQVTDHGRAAEEIRQLLHLARPFEVIDPQGRDGVDR